MQCPDHPRALVATAAGELECPFCRGALLSPERFEQVAPTAPLAVETRADAAVFAAPRVCPSCAVPMVPWRIGALEAWLDACPSCGGRWVEPGDRRSLTMLATKAARAQAWKSFSPEQRAEMAKDLAANEVPDEALTTELSAGETVKAVVGLPVVAGARGEGVPVVTIAAALLCACFFAMGLLDDQWGFDELAWRARDGVSWRLVTAMWAHAGWGHLLGNLLFLWTFGELVERRVSHGLLAAGYLAVGLATTWIQGLVSPPTTLIGGASGAIFGLVGLTAFVQPKATLKVLPMGLGLLHRGRLVAIKVPLWLGVVGYFALQLLWWSFDSPGVAWVAHLSGLALGAVAGWWWKRREA